MMIIKGSPTPVAVILIIIKVAAAVITYEPYRPKPPHKPKSPSSIVIDSALVDDAERWGS